MSPAANVARVLERDDLGLLGIRRTTRIGRRFNGRRYGGCLQRRIDGVERHLAMIREARTADHGLEPTDGYLIDDSQSLPHLDEAIADMEEVIAERGGQRWEDVRKIFLQSILPADGHLRYGSLVDFVTSPEVLEPVTEIAGFVPHLSEAQPRGIRLMESSTDHDPTPEVWRLSQFWHMDYHATPTIYVIVAVRDIGPEDGPMHFLGAAASKRVAESLDYGARNSPYRVVDESVEPLIDPDEVQSFTGPAGTALFLDSSRCFHFGSRNPRSRRYHLQYAYVSPVRNDFGDILRDGLDYPVGPEDPPYRRLALDRTYLPA